MSDIIAVAGVKVELMGSAVDLGQVSVAVSDLPWVELSEERAEYFEHVCVAVPITREWRSIRGRLREVLVRLRAAKSTLAPESIRVVLTMGSDMLWGWDFDSQDVSLIADLQASLTVNVFYPLAPDEPKA